MNTTRSLRHWLAVAATLTLAHLLPTTVGACPTAAAPPTIAQPCSGNEDGQRARVLDAYARLPLMFVENQGQTDPRVQFHVRGARHAFFVTRDQIVLSLARQAPRGVALALRFVGANAQAAIEGEELAAAETHYFRGSDPAHWQTQLRGYAQVVYRDLWPGVDLAVRGQGGTLKYEFRVKPGARPSDIRLAYAGADGLALDEAGRLLIRSPLGTLRDAAPVSWQDIDGVRVPVRSGYVLGAENAYGFSVGAEYRPDHELIIDPALEYSTFLGGAAGDDGAGIAVDAAGNAYIVGTTQSADFPTTVGAFDRTPGDSVNGPDVFVSKLNPSGTALLYSTYLGGSLGDFGRAIAIDAAGNAYVTGKTQSANFPTTSGAFDRTANIPQTPRPQTIDDGFVTKLNPSGSALVYSTYLGGTDDDQMRAIAVDAGGNAYVTGETVSRDYPITAGAVDTSHNGEYDVLVTKLNPSGSALVYSTFLGGVVSDIANAIKVDAANQAYVAGSTRSADFPTTPGAFDTTHNGEFDGFVAKLNAAGSALVYSTFLGGTAGDDASGLAIDAAGNAYVTGGTGSPGFPTTPGAYDTVFSPSGDGFVLKLNPSGSALVYSTFLRGAGPGGIAIDAAGNAWITGTTGAEDFPITLDGFDLSFNGVSDAFVTGLNATGSGLLYSTLLGGNNADNGRAIALDASGNIYVTGSTRSSDFPTTPGALDRIFNGDLLVLWGDGFVAKFNAAAVSPAHNGPTLAALTLDPASVVAGAPSTGTVTLSAPAFSGGSVVALSDDSAATAVPASVTVPAGATTATFAVSTNNAVPDGTSSRIVGILGTARSATLTVLPPPPLLASVAVNPGSVVGGNPATAVVTLSSARPTPTVISIDPPPPTAPATLPASVTVPAGATSASFTIATQPVTLTFNLTIGVRLQGASSPGPTALLLIAPGTTTSATLSTLSLSASSVVGGGFLNGSVVLTGAAPSGGAVVTLSDNSTAATTPSSVTVPAGATSASFILTSTAVAADVNVTLTATFNGVVRTLVLTVTAPPPGGAALSALSVAPGSVVGGTPASGTVVLSAPAPAGGALVTLSSSSNAASVQSSVTVAAGATSVSFTIATAAVTAVTPATITAALAGVARTATLTVNPPSTQSTLAVTATGRNGERVTSSPAGINVAVGSTASASFAGNTAITLSVSNGRSAIWSGACSSGGNKTRTCTFTIKGNASVRSNVQ